MASTGEHEEHVIEVSGSGTASIAPDLAAVTLGVELNGPSLAPLQAETRRAMHAVMEALKASGVESRRIRTAAYGIEPVYHELDRKRGYEQRRLAGYKATHLVEARIGALDRTGEVIDAALAAGANSVEGMESITENAAPGRAIARERAMADAWERAEQLAALGKVKIGSPIRISEAFYSYGSRHARSTMAIYEAAPSMAPATEIEPGDSELSVTVNVTFPIVVGDDGGDG